MCPRFASALFGIVAVLSPAYALAADNPSNEAIKPMGSEMLFQSSDLSDLNVYNQHNTNQKLGNLDNLIVNAHTGHLLYAILDTGLGGKKLIVPWNAFRLHASTDNSSKGKYWLSLNKTSNDLANAPTFDKKHLPPFTQSRWVHSIDEFFGVSSTMPKKSEGGRNTLSTNQMILQSSELGDMNVYNRTDNKKLGAVDNLIINASNGQVLYGILNTGLGGKYVPVPWNAFLLTKETGKAKYWLTLDKTADELKNAPTFDKNQLAELAQSDRQRSIDKFFGVRTAARPKR